MFPLLEVLDSKPLVKKKKAIVFHTKKGTSKQARVAKSSEAQGTSARDKLRGNLDSGGANSDLKAAVIQQPLQTDSSFANDGTKHNQRGNSDDLLATLATAESIPESKVTKKRKKEAIVDNRSDARGPTDTAMDIEPKELGKMDKPMGAATGVVKVDVVTTKRLNTESVDDLVKSKKAAVVGTGSKGW